MPMTSDPTPYSDVNVVLTKLRTCVQSVLGRQFVGMYLYGSLALGDFDLLSSDIDFIVVTDAELSEDLVDALRRLHVCFRATDSPWSSRIEAAYIPCHALRANVPASARYPQVEKDRGFTVDTVESGWVIQLLTLREHGIVVEGPDPRTLIAPLDPVDIRRASAAHALVWSEQAEHDPDWLTWIRIQENLAFVVLTLCRMLYTLEAGSVASKPRAAQWMIQTSGNLWAGLIRSALLGQHTSGSASDREVRKTIALLNFIVERYQRHMMVVR
jgi:Domain of unknown function (DUF4111)/Nucleotidyltransferase domain